jgi:hypothetical protein
MTSSQARQPSITTGPEATNLRGLLKRYLKVRFSASERAFSVDILCPILPISLVLFGYLVAINAPRSTRQRRTDAILKGCQKRKEWILGRADLNVA